LSYDIKSAALNLCLTYASFCFAILPHPQVSEEVTGNWRIGSQELQSPISTT